MVALATAFVRVRADTSSFKGDVEKGLSKAGGEKAAEKKGRSIGESFSKGFGDGGSTFTRVAATMASRATIITGAVSAATPAVANFVAALAPAAGAVNAVAPAVAGLVAVTQTLKVAVGGTGEAISKGLSGDVKAYEKALDKLTPQQADFARKVVESGDAVEKFQAAVSDRFLSPIMKDIQPLTQTFMPVLTKQMGGLAGELGKFAHAVAVTARQGPVVQALTAVFQQTGSSVSTLRTQIGQLINALARGLTSVMPILGQLSSSVTGLIPRFTAWLNEAARTGSLVASFERARKTLNDLAAILGNLGAIARVVFGQATGGADTLLARLRQMTTSAREFVESARGGQQLSDLFRTLGVFGEALRKSLAGVLPEVGESLRIAAPVAGQFATALSGVIVSMAPLLPALTGVTAQLVTALIPAITSFSGWLTENQGVLRAIAPLLLGYAVAARAVAAATVVATVATRAWAVVMGIAKAGQAAWTAIEWLAVAPKHANTLATKISMSTVGTWIGVKALEAKAWLVSTGGAIKDTAAKAANRTATLASAAASKIAAAANAVGTWAAATAGVIANTAATVANKVAVLASAAAQKIAAAATVVWTVAVNASAVAMRAAGVALRFMTGPIGLAITAIGLITAAIVYLWKNNETFRRIVLAVWSAIKTAIAAVGNWFANTLWPMIKRAIDLLIAYYKFLWSAVKFVWNAIWQGILLYWNYIKTIFNAIKTFITVTLPAAFQAGKNWILKHWLAFQGGIRYTWDVVRGIFNNIKTFITQTIPNAFRSGVNAIKAAWEKVQDAAKKPVTFVVRSVLNPLIRGYNKIAGIFHAPQANEIPGFASGGRIPGVSSDRDNRLASVFDAGRRMAGAVRVATGEFITNSRSTSANLPLISAINRKRGRVTRADVDPYLDGGGGDGIGDFFGKVFNGLKGAADFVLNPVEGLKKIANAAMAKIPGGGSVVTMLKGMGKSVIDGLGKFLSDFGGAIGGGGVAGGWRGMRALISGQFPGLGMISGFRPGAVTLSGNRSYHALGRAVDYPPSLPLATWIRARFGRNTKELITPWNNLNLHNGRPHRYTGAVWNQHNFAGGNAHVHWAAALGGLIDRLSNTPVVKLFDRGGTLAPGVNTVYNGTGRDEHLVPVGGQGGTLRLHPADLAELGRIIGREIASAIGASNYAAGRQVGLYSRGG